MSPIRALHLLKATGIAGAETHLLALLPALREFDVATALLIMEDPRLPQGEFATRAEAAGVPTARVPITAHIDPFVVPRLRRAMGELEGRGPGGAPFDLLHAHLPHGEVYGAQLAGAFPHMHFLITRHSDDRFRRSRLLRPVFAASLQHAERIIAISHAVARSIMALEQCLLAKIEVVHYGLAGGDFAGTARRGSLRAELGLARRTADRVRWAHGDGQRAWTCCCAPLPRWRATCRGAPCAGRRRTVDAGDARASRSTGIG